MKTAADILKQKPHTFNFIEPGARVADALNLMNAMNRSFLVVMHDDQYSGIFSEHDFIHKVAMAGLEPEKVLVKEVMDVNLPTVDMDAPVEDVIALMNAHHARYVPVFSGLIFEGVITLHNLMNMVLQNREQVFGRNPVFPQATGKFVL
jgi:CBS domain-containing protein